MGKTPKTFFEFFAGIGLVRLGLQSDGWKCLWANDIDQDKQRAYELNFPAGDFVLEDIWKLTPRDIPGRAFMATASFPCTDLSIAGDRKGIKGEESGTVHAFMRLLQGLRSQKRLPRIVMLENVIGLVNINGGSDLVSVLSMLAELGYCVDALVVNAEHFVPQSRPRIFIFGVDRKIARQHMVFRELRETFCQWDQEVASFPELRPDALRRLMVKHTELPWCAFRVKGLPHRIAHLRECLQAFPVSDNLWWPKEKKDKLHSQMSHKHRSILNQMIASDTFSFGTIYRRVRKTGSMAELRTDGVAGCLRTPRGGSSRQLVLQAGRGDFHVRWMTPREYGNLQGVPPEFQLIEHHNKALFGLGDAVCVPAVRWISETLLSPLYDVYTKEKPSNRSLLSISASSASASYRGGSNGRQRKSKCSF